MSQMPLPKYHQIYLLLCEQLAEGRFADGLPGEFTLMEEFGVARVTVRRALEKMAADPPRKKVTLVWNGDDVERAMGSLFHNSGDVKKYIDLPLANYSTLPYDKVVSGGKTIGLSTYTGYNFNERAMLSLAILNNEQSEPGTQVTLVWGEEGRGTTKPTVERHAQVEIRATVAPAPISSVAREAYRPKALA